MEVYRNGFHNLQHQLDIQHTIDLRWSDSRFLKTKMIYFQTVHDIHLGIAVKIWYTTARILPWDWQKSYLNLTEETYFILAVCFFLMVKLVHLGIGFLVVLHFTLPIIYLPHREGEEWLLANENCWDQSTELCKAQSSGRGLGWSLGLGGEWSTWPQGESMSGAVRIYIYIYWLFAYVHVYFHTHVYILYIYI